MDGARETVKVTKEKLPKSLLALDIELDKDQVEKGLDRAARQLSQKYNIPGFRKGKAPRFIVENYFGRDALVEQATEDLINKSFRTALEQESIDPVGQASIDSVDAGDPFHFRVLVPVAPTVTIPDYKGIKLPLEVEPVTDEVVQSALDELREKHVVLRELEESRGARQGDQLGVRLQTFIDGQPIEEIAEDAEVPVTTLVLEPGRVVDGLLKALEGVEPGQIFEAPVHMPEDHANEKVRGKDVVFGGQIETIQERLLPDWDELPTLENFEGDLEALRAKTRTDLESAARSVAERKVLDGFIEQLVAGTEYDVPDVMVHERAHSMLHEQGAQFERYGISLDQMLQYRGKTHEQAVEELEEEAGQQLKQSLALQQVIAGEELTVSTDEINAEIDRAVQDYDEAERATARQVLGNQLRTSIANNVLDRKLRDRILLLAAGVEPAAEPEPQPAASLATTEEATGTPAQETTEEAEGPTDSEAPTTDVRNTQPPTESTAEFEGPTEDEGETAPAEIAAEEATGTPATETPEDAKGPSNA
jgi:trigger factor